MIPYGPFTTDASFYPDRTSLYYEVQVGRLGYLEFINLSGFDLKVTMPQGSVTLEARSKTIWQIPAAYQGQLPLQVTPQLYYQIQPLLSPPQFFYANPIAGTASILWINSYEESEIEWYPPISLPVPTGSMLFATSTANPPNISIGPFISYPLSSIYLWGLDVTANNPSAGAASILTISGLLSGPLEYVFASFSTTVPTPLIVRWNPPLPAIQGQGIKLTSTALTGAVMSTTLYYTVP